jgi:glutathione S-transferase
MAKYLLVSFKTCPWVQRAAIVLREKKIDFEFRHIEPDNRPDWFLAISPHKKVPVLRLDDKVSLFESNAIAEFLDETVAPRLAPEDPIARAVNRAWTDYVPSFAEAVTATAYADTEADFEKAAARIPLPFERLETALEKQGAGPFFNAWAEALIARPSTHSFPPAEFEALYRQNVRRRNKWISQFIEAVPVAAE